MVKRQGEHGWENERGLSWVGEEHVIHCSASCGEFRLEVGTVGSPKMGEGWVELVEIRWDSVGAG
jgi:hypothetical protein